MIGRNFMLKAECLASIPLSHDPSQCWDRGQVLLPSNLP